MTGSLMQRLLREPLLGFLLAGALVYAFYPGEEAGEAVIAVSEPQLAAIAEEFRLRQGRAPTPEEHGALLQRFIDEEVMVREAYARGLDRSDGRVRQRLIGKIDFLIEEEPGEPTAADLDAIYQASPQNYRVPTQVDILLRRADAMSSDASADKVVTYYGMVKEGLAALLGEGAAQIVFTDESGDWLGPWTAQQGQVFVKVSARRDAVDFDEDTRRQYLREDWLISERQRIRREKLDELRQKYRLDIAPLPTAPAVTTPAG